MWASTEREADLSNELLMPLKWVWRKVGIPDCVLQEPLREACATGILPLADWKIQERGNSMTYAFHEQSHLKSLAHGIWHLAC